MSSLMFHARKKALLLGALLAAGLVAGCEFPPQESAQSGYRGTGMSQITNKAKAEAIAFANSIPEVQPEADDTGPKASEVYQNVKVLGHLSEGQFLRVMSAMTEWVAPEQGCAYCHNVENMADDSMYTKIVSRRMIEMTRTINTTWKPHVAETGVTCYTCHRGQPVPANIWFSQKDHIAAGSAADNKGHNTPAPNASYSSLPRDAFTPLLASAGQIRVIGKDALSTDAPGESIATTERTYSLMMHMSTGLGVNCTFCHNTRAFAEWDQSPPQRVTAWHGIRMVQGLNATYLEPLKSTYPTARLGPEGDAPKANCATCHQGVSKPLGGVSMLKDYIKDRSAPPR